MDFEKLQPYNGHRTSEPIIFNSNSVQSGYSPQRHPSSFDLMEFETLITGRYKMRWLI